MNKGLKFSIFVLLVTAFTSTAFAELDLVTDDGVGHRKSSWYIGFGLGWGDGSWEFENGEEVTFDDFTEDSDDSTRIAFNFGIGGIVNPQFHLGLDINAIRQEASANIYGTEITASMQINNYMLSAFYYPMNEGIFLKAGIGRSVYQMTISGGPFKISESESGLALLGGIGYAAWLGETFNLCFHLDYTTQSYGEVIDSSKFWAIYMSAYWF